MKDFPRALAENTLDEYCVRVAIVARY